MNKLFLIAGLMLAAGTASADFTSDLNSAFDSLNQMNDYAKGVIDNSGAVNAYAARLGGSVARISNTGRATYAVETSNGCEFSVKLAYKGARIKGLTVNKDAVCR